MLLSTPNNRLWQKIGIFLIVLSIIPYYVYRQQVPRGGTTVGLAYGIAGSIIICFLLFQAVRKRWYRCTLGRTEIWVNAHIYLGILAMLLIFLHAGFRFNELSGVIATIFLSTVVISGIVGTILYDQFPEQMHAKKGNITPQQLSDEINQLQEKLFLLSVGKSDTFQSVCKDVLAATRKMKDKTNQKIDQYFAERLNEIKKSQPIEYEKLISLMTELREKHGRFCAWIKIKNMISSWLYLHVPFSVAMVVAIIGHLLTVLYY
ncbi:MAG: hypothetical protein AAB300_03535 [Nitrospirota bacterium]